MSNLCLSSEQSKQIEELLCNVLRNKFKNYKPKNEYMPFHTRLLGNDRLTLYSFIHSLNTNFGTTVFEPVARQLASGRFKEAYNHASPARVITSGAMIEIDRIINGLRSGASSPDKANEIDSIRKVCQTGEPQKVKLTMIDLKLKDHDDRLYFFDIKAAKPNVGQFQEFKRTLLEWVAAELYVDPDRDITTAIAIPYNPYEPEPYSIWTMKGMMDIDRELKVAEAFWDFLGGKGAYEDILTCFENVGITMRDEIDSFFSNFNHK